MNSLKGAIAVAGAMLVFTATTVTAQRRVDSTVATTQNANATPQKMAGPDTTVGQTAAVIIRYDTVLIVPGRFGSFSAADRASALVARIAKYSGKASDSVKLVATETSTDLVIGETVMMTVTDADAAALGEPRETVAKAFAASISRELRTVSKSATLRTVAVGAAYTLLTTLALLLLFALLRRAFKRIDVALRAWRTRMPAVRFQKLELLSAAALIDALRSVVRFLRAAIVVVLLYFYLLIVLSLFPWTRPYSGQILGYVTSPLRQVGSAFLEYLPNIFFIAVIVVVARYVLKAIHIFFDAVERGHVSLGGFEPEWADPTYKIVRFLVMAFGVVVLFPYLPGGQSEAFKGVSLFFGVLFSLGSSSAISNVVAGVVLTYTRAFNIGDRISIGDTTGDVVTKTLLVTRIRTIKNVDITIPNAMVLSSHIKNFSAMAKSDGLILHTTITIGYDAPWKQVHDLMLNAAKATAGIIASPEPFVLQTSLDDFYVSYEINAYTDQPSVMARTYGLLHANIQDKFNEAGVEIMSPHYSTLRDGNQTTIPTDYLSKNYQAPPFVVRQGKEE
ncbi:MAG: mechanosensitive ion channel family protein [Gemmatimonadaceae bacterium]